MIGFRFSHPRNISSYQGNTRSITSIRSSCVPEPAVIDQHASSGPSNLHLSGIGSPRVDSDVSCGVVPRPVTARNHQSSTIIVTERREHPQRGQLQRQVWMGGVRQTSKP